MLIELKVPTPGESITEVELGKWLVEDGDFVEKVSISAPNLEPELHEHSGTWFYDGTNIKRTYLLMDGRAPSRLNLPYVTFEVKIKSKNEFLGIDHIHHHEVRYVRLPE